MRRFWIFGCLIGALSSWAHADAQTMSGCGLGYILVSHGSDSRFLQVFGATTNNTFGSQTFGITSGTSGCNQDGSVVKGKHIQAYAEVNFDSLRREMALGQGEFVEAFAGLLEPRVSDHTALLKRFQTEYIDLFPTENITPMDLMQTLGQKGLIS